MSIEALEKIVEYISELKEALNNIRDSLHITDIENPIIEYKNYIKTSIEKDRNRVNLLMNNFRLGNNNYVCLNNCYPVTRCIYSNLLESTFEEIYKVEIPYLLKSFETSIETLVEISAWDILGIVSLSIGITDYQTYLDIFALLTNIKKLYNEKYIHDSAVQELGEILKIVVNSAGNLEKELLASYSKNNLPYSKNNLHGADVIID